MKMIILSLMSVLVGQCAFAMGSPYSTAQASNTEVCDPELILPSGKQMSYASCVVADTGAQAKALAKFGGPCICGRKSKVTEIKVRRTRKGTDNELSSEQFGCMTGEHAEPGQYIAIVSWICK